MENLTQEQGEPSRHDSGQEETCQRIEELKESMDAVRQGMESVERRMTQMEEQQKQLASLCERTQYQTDQQVKYLQLLLEERGRMEKENYDLLSNRIQRLQDGQLKAEAFLGDVLKDMREQSAQLLRQKQAEFETFVQSCRDQASQISTIYETFQDSQKRLVAQEQKFNETRISLNGQIMDIQKDVRKGAEDTQKTFSEMQESVHTLLLQLQTLQTEYNSTVKSLQQSSHEQQNVAENVQKHQKTYDALACSLSSQQNSISQMLEDSQQLRAAIESVQQDVASAKGQTVQQNLAYQSLSKTLKGEAITFQQQVNSALEQLSEQMITLEDDLGRRVANASEILQSLHLTDLYQQKKTSRLQVELEKMLGTPELINSAKISQAIIARLREIENQLAYLMTK